MAVHPWELESEHNYVSPNPVGPRLELVPAPPRGGRVIPALLFVALLIGTMGYPVIRAATKGLPVVPREVPRPLPVSQLAALDRISALPEGKRPMSSEPAGGILFVRCTNLWAAQPDGSHARKVLSFSGISSPAFSPDAKTIAFIGPTELGQGLFMVAADGAHLTQVGSLVTHGTPIAARVTNLTWSEKGNKLAFALVDPTASPWSGGSTIWSWSSDTGWFDRVATGWPAPTFIDGRLVYSTMRSNPRDLGASFHSEDRGARYMTSHLSSRSTDELSFGVAPGNFSDTWSTPHGAVVLRRNEKGDLELVAKASAWEGKVRSTYVAPSPYSFYGLGRVSVAQDASRALVDLRDPHGDRALGILDLETDQWTVLEYAWSGASTPAPSSSGPLGAQRAQRLAGDVFSSWRRYGDYTAAALLIGDRDIDRFSMRRGSYALGLPVRGDGGWEVPVTTYGKKDHRYSYRIASLFVGKTKDDRVQADVRYVGPDHPLETIEDAKSFIASVTGDVGSVWPSNLPSGATLNKRWPVDAYSWNDTTTASVHLYLPTVEGEKFRRTLNISYGDVDFGLGCGGENDPEEGEVGGKPALYDHLGRGATATRQVIWPATLDHRDIGKYSVYGQLPRGLLKRIAGSMAAQG